MTPDKLRFTEARDHEGILTVTRDRWTDTGEDTLCLTVYMSAADEQDEDEWSTFLLSPADARRLGEALVAAVGAE